MRPLSQPVPVPPPRSTCTVKLNCGHGVSCGPAHQIITKLLQALVRVAGLYGCGGAPNLVLSLEMRFMTLGLSWYLAMLAGFWATSWKAAMTSGSCNQVKDETVR